MEKRNFVVLMANQGEAYNWFVDSVSGSDSNTGKSPAQAFATIAKLATVWAAGESIGLAKGSTWKEQLTVPGDNCKVFAYGSGNRPILDCSTVFANAGFTKTVGQTNIYQTDITTNYVASEPSFVSVWEDNVRLTFQTSLANCDANAGTYYVASHNNTTITVYVHASDSSDITANGKVYEISNRLSGIFGLTRTGTIVNGIHAKRNYSNGGSIKLGRQTQLIDCVAEEGNSHNVYVCDGSTLTNVTATKAYWTAGFTLFVHNENTPASLGVIYNGCVASLATYDVNGTGFYGHKNTSGDFGNISYTNCSTTNCDKAFSFVDCVNITVTGGTHTDTQTIFNLTNSGITSLTISGVTQNASVRGRFVYVSGSITPPTISASSCTASVARLVGDTGMIFVQSDTTISVTDSSFTNSYTVASGCFFMYASGAGIQMFLTSLRNIFHTPGIASGPYIYNLQQNANTDVTSDYNTVSRAASFYHNGTNYGTLALWVAGTGQDTHSVVG